MKFKGLLATTMMGLTLLAAGCGGGSSDKKAASDPAQQFKGKKLVMYVSFHEDTAKGLAELFKKKTGAEVSFIRLPTGEAVARLTAEKDNPKASIWIGGPSDAHELVKSKGITEKYESPNLKLIPTDFRDRDAFWAGVYIEALAIGAVRQAIAQDQAIGCAGHHELDVIPGLFEADQLSPGCLGFRGKIDPRRRGGLYVGASVLCLIAEPRDGGTGFGGGRRVQGGASGAQPGQGQEGQAAKQVGAAAHVTG